ncbi:MAG: DEAD/DEAH box helicase [Clostridiales bacterium]|nr:DEAD/DEAH box helicase [Clostridiales bacterium]
MKTFKELNLNKEIIEGLNKQNIKTPTEIQNLVIEDILNGFDVLAESFTGSGKTLAFVAPILQKIDTSKKEMQCLILAPTHELVIQTENQIKLLSKNSCINVTSLPIMGDVNIDRQIKKIKDTKPHIIVGTAGRVMDLIKKKKITAHTLKTIVIDEADNLLDNTSKNMVKDIIKKSMRDTQILMFSASINENALKTAMDILKNPKIHKSSKKLSINPNINHFFIEVDKRDKFETLRKLIAAENPTKAIVFVNNAYDLKNTSEKLNFHNKTTFTLSKNVSKESRQNALESFRKGKINILVSSDLSARGLDINDVTHIINLDFPSNSEEYLHRAGRTARGKASGKCISIVTSREITYVKKYEKIFNIKIKKASLKNGNLI